MQKKKILVVAAHPDDEVLGAGAMIAKHIGMGDEVQVVILGEGITSRKGDEHAESKLSQLGEHSQKANAILGTSKVHYKNLPDNKFDTVSLLSITQAIEEIANELQPDIVYTHHHGDVNIDHRRTSEAVQAAFRPMQGASVKEVYAFEIASSSEWNFRHDNVFRPNVFIDVSGDAIEKKIQAMEAYSSEIREFPHPRSSAYLRALATVRGGQAGMQAAEAFELVYQRN